MLASFILLQSISALSELVEFRMDKVIKMQEKSWLPGFGPEVVVFQSFAEDLLYNKHAGFYFTDYNFMSKIFNLSINPSNSFKLNLLAKNQGLIYDQIKRSAVCNSGASAFDTKHASNLFNFLLNNFLDTVEKMSDINPKFLLEMVRIYSNFCKRLVGDRITGADSENFPFNDVFQDLMHGLAYVDNNFSHPPIKNIIYSCINLYSEFQISCESLLDEIKSDDMTLENNFYQKVEFGILKKISEKVKDLFVTFEELVANENRTNSGIFRRESLLLYYIFGKFRTLMTMVNFIASFRFLAQANNQNIWVDTDLFKYLASMVIHLTCYASKYDNYVAKMASLHPLAMPALSKPLEGSYFRIFSSNLEKEKNFDPMKKLDLKLLNKNLRDEFTKKTFKKYNTYIIDAIFPTNLLNVVSRFNLAIDILKMFVYKDPRSISFNTLMKDFSNRSIEALRYSEFCTFKVLASLFIENIAGSCTPSSPWVPFRHTMLHSKVNKLLESLGKGSLSEVLSPDNFVSLVQSDTTPIVEDEGFLKKSAIERLTCLLILALCTVFFLSYKIFKLLNTKSVAGKDMI